MMTGAEIDDAKRVLRRRMRAVRNGLTDRPERSSRILAALTQHPSVRAADRIMVFTSLVGEPETASFIAWCTETGKHVSLPEDEGLDPTWADVMVIPGVAFVLDGRRLGQGGGWYDRFLPDRRADCTTIGVCFAAQLVDDLPTDQHDVVLDIVLTD